MENHPIPQDVTGFQFKLVGNMTIKQFAYVGVGVILAVVLFYSPLAWYLKFILVPGLAVSGISLAFLPIGGRPMDLMAAYFIRAVLKPNQYVYQKIGGTLSFTELNLQPVLPKLANTQHVNPNSAFQVSKKEEQLLNYLYSTPVDSSNPLDQKENQRLSSLFSTGPQLPNVPPSPSQPIQETAVPIVMPAPNITTTWPTPIQTPANQNFENDTTLEQIVPDQPQQPTPTSLPAAPTAIVQIVPQDEAISTQKQPQHPAVGVEFSNLINGIVKDSRGNVLAGILIEVLNKDNESVRAFRTNALGQFASATQLVNGVYTITFEDPKGQHKFENIQIEANGNILPPLIITSVDAREELRRSLFG